MEILHFWGKAQSLNPDHGTQWHPLVCHSLDVAAVGDVLLTRDYKLGRRLSRLLGLTYKETIAIVRFLFCLHDIGKFAKKFQAKVPAFYPQCMADSSDLPSTYYRHDTGGLRFFLKYKNYFGSPYGDESDVWLPLISAVMGHHGSPPMLEDETLRPDFGKVGIEAAKTFICQIKELGFLAPKKSTLKSENARRGSFVLAGLAVLADWIGSNEKWFPYFDLANFMGLEDYWNDARKKAEHAVTAAGILPAATQTAVPDGYESLIGSQANPSPMQKWARSVKLPAGPALFVIEDETGSGKTETALMLAHRLIADDRADGIYVALPTMTTANAMFDRLCTALSSLFMPKANPSIALVHGTRNFHPGFQAAVIKGADQARSEEDYPGGSRLDSDTTASAACAAWVADDRRCSFLADVGAGTIDQALLSILPSRHQSLRLLGLTRRILIVDEVHAYDAYMQREIESLLEFQAGLGGNAILLSATLPQTLRKRLLTAFSKGLDEPAQKTKEVSNNCMNYPLATICAAREISETKVSCRPDRARKLPVHFLRSEQEAFAAVEDAAQAGKAVLYIRNTVDDALDAYWELIKRKLQVELFHARFALIDRLGIEERVIKTFGKKSVPNERNGKVLVATQVVEQSLDLDFDALITDLAPIDLLIQRAGRLWRHSHRERNGNPKLQIVTPEPNRNVDANWLKALFPRVASIYNHAQLWLTAKTLEERKSIDSPDGLRSLIESVYSEEAEGRVPPGLQEISLIAEGRARADSGIAQTNVLQLCKGYMRYGGAWDDDVRTPTRLANDPHATLRLARYREGKIEPYAHHGQTACEPWRAWRLSEVSVSERIANGEDSRQNHADAVDEAKKSWTRFDRKKILVVLEEKSASLLTGSVSKANSPSATIVYYSPEQGLTW